MKISNNKGFTLIEMIVTLVIVVLIFTLITPLFVTGINFFRDSNSMVKDQANLRKTMTDLSREIRDATVVNVISATEIEVGDCTYKYVADDKQITKYRASADSTVVISRGVVFFEVTQNDDIIEFTVRADGAGSTIVTKVSVRGDKTLQSPPIA